MTLLQFCLCLFYLPTTTQSIKFFISSPVYSPNRDLIKQANIPFPVHIDHKIDQNDNELAEEFIDISLKFDNQEYIARLWYQEFQYHFDTASNIQLSRRNKEQVLMICKTIKLVGTHQCSDLHIALRKILVASMCSRAITHVCVEESCASFQGGKMLLNVTLRETGVHWLEIKPHYSQPACYLDKHVHIVSSPELRVVVVDCQCPFVSAAVSPTHGSWKTKNKKEGQWQTVKLVTTKQKLMDCKREEPSNSLGRVCIIAASGPVVIGKKLDTTQNMSLCLEQGIFDTTMDIFVKSPSTVKLETWWEGSDGKNCANITTTTTFNTYVANQNNDVYQGNGITRSKQNQDQERVVLTGLNDNYFQHLEQLIGSLKLWASDITIEIVDLGLSIENIDRINKWGGRIKVVPFNFQNYPTHVKDLGTYAFKILAIKEGLDRHHPNGILWIDAGLVVRDLDRAWHEMDGSEGKFFIARMPTLSEHAFPWGDSSFHHPKTMEKLEIDKVNMLQTQCEAGVQGWNKQGSFYEKAFPLLVSCALDVGCIAPIGSNRQNHLQDQTVLNAVFSKLGVDPCQNNKLFDSEFNLFDTIHTRIDMREFYPAAMFRRSFHESRDIFEVYL